MNQVLDLILKEIRGLKDTLDDTELQRAKNQLKGNILLALESTSSRMNNIARQEIYYGKYHTPKEIIHMIDAITLTDAKNLADKLINSGTCALTVYGPVDEDFNGML